MSVVEEKSRSDIHARSRARRVAVQAIYQWQMTGADLDGIRAEFQERERPGSFDEAFFGELLTQVTGEVEMLDALLQPELDRPVMDVDPVERAILRIGAWELSRQSGTPWKVVINEAVNLTRKFGATDSHGYINAVLDRIARKVRPDQSS